MWHHGEEALAKALVASKLYRAMASEAADDDLEVEIFDELRSYAAEFDREALELLDYCYRQDDDLAQQLLTCELSNWSRQTCLRLAFACHHRELLAHPCAQLILGDLWLGGLRTRRSTNLKIVLAIVCPAFIFRLEFKSKNELLLMPQTETEHMIDLKEEDEHPLAEKAKGCSFCSPPPTVSVQKEHFRSINWKCDTVNCLEVSNGDDQNGTQCHFCSNDTIHAGSHINGMQDIPNSQTDIHHETVGLKCTVIDHHQLSFHRKLLEFYSAPITKFWTWTMAYFFFLAIYTYTLLIRTPPRPEWNECYVIIYISSFGIEIFRQILASEPVNLSRKLAVWASSAWNCCDAFFIVEFFVGLILREQENTLEQGRVLYCLNIVFWYIRILLILRVSRFLGPFVTMIGWMLKRMVYYVTLMLVVLMSYGVFRQSVLFPHEEFSWFLVRDIFFKPYFMIYGELFADDINPPCGNGTKPDGSFDPEMPPCETGRWLNPLLMTAYLLVINILLLNLLIAVFNSIFLKTNVHSHKIWKFNRFAVVMDYDQKPTLPPPFIIFCHIVLFTKWIQRRFAGVKESYDCGLKLFLDKHDLERLYDFEEESMEGLVREREAKQNQTTDERIRLLGQRMDSISSKMDDSYQLDNGVVLLDSLESRLTLLEKAIERTTDTCIALHDCVISQESFSQPLSKQATSMTLSQATTLLTLDGETWTSTPILSDSSSSTSEDGQVYGRANESEKGCEVYRQGPNSGDEPIRPLVRTKLERRSTTSRLQRKKVILKRQLTEIQSESDNSAAIQQFAASDNAVLNSRFPFPKDVSALQNGQLENIRKPSPLFRADSRISNNGGEKYARSFLTAKVVAETQRLREMEGDVYRLMGGVIRRRRYLESENYDPSLEEMAGIPTRCEDDDMTDEDETIIFRKNLESFTITIEDSRVVSEDATKTVDVSNE
ncbi:hypothetical protein OUZ56_014200 [Daphnia magna]|uniref:Transient receptor potential cation channel subfamily M member n=1 Tax=Daphnia magna TaxID=35525 RepID=A0ABQ9Z838_9CRUS|nr:hypothetical protein OUZ56_014200 [Daphnia magna]